MLGKIFGSFGGLIGNMFGGGVISTTFKFAGRYLGNYITESSYSLDETYSFSNHLDDISTQPSNFPYIIPIIFGKARIRGRIIWSLNLKESAHETTKTKYFKISNLPKSKHHHTNYEYNTDFALSLAEGEITDFNRVWINGKETNISEYNFRFYKGTEDQMPDPLILQHEKHAPAFRGISYIIFENFPLKEFGNKIPAFEFELIRRPKNSVADLVRNICIIPGCGEFLYDTEIIEKRYYAEIGEALIDKQNINCHNHKNQPDAIYNLDSMQENFVNIESVSIIVTWFANSLDAGSADIYPAIENREINSSKEWKVASYTRQNAIEISKDEYGNPNYGGTVNDESVIRYLEELKRRNIKIMFNPMILLDIKGKPWRGHISGNISGIERFFRKYRKFIIHYAYLTKDYIDFFLIGSELKGLTGIREENRYPAVDELIKLASDVKSILGQEIKISYGADWSEYHHKDGFYNLDSLWASENIDFIGIDAYFPLTCTTISEISSAEIKKGFESGEGFSYFFENSEKKDLEAAWAWKNIKYWWENKHYNADGSISPWIPKSKKIYFTEFGFPSIDKAPNQPNIFYDPNCLDGGIPKYSNGEVDFEIQRKSIKAFLEYWEDSEMIEKSFLWAWDARPQPAWPHEDIWRDSNLWLKGHWINDKLSYYNLSDILTELCIRSGYKKEEIKAAKISDQLEGMVIDRDSSALDTISMLQSLYFFDLRTNEHGHIEFISQKGHAVKEIDSLDLIKEKRIIETKETTINNSISHIRLSYISYFLEYNPDFLEIFDEKQSATEILDFKIPILINAEKAENICRKIISSRHNQKSKIKLLLPYYYLMKIDISDSIFVKYRGEEICIRISSVRYENYKCCVEGYYT